MLLSFRKRAWQDYLYWFATDRKMCKRIHDLIEDTQRHPFQGKGKPEGLRVSFKVFGLGALTRTPYGLRSHQRSTHYYPVYVIITKSAHDS